ncbi:T9SS type A sorting domain-containing protein [Bacteroidota bacterium]
MINYRYYKKLFWIFVLACLSIANQIYSQQQGSNHNVLISGFGGQHDLDVKQAFLIGYSSYNSSSFDGNVELFYDYAISSSFAYAENNNYDIIIRSTTGLSYFIYAAIQHPDVELIMPSGSNSHIETFSGNLQDCPIIATGAGTTSNVTGYQIDFYSIDPITTSNLSSFANGYIAGQIVFISDYLGISIDEARSRARESGSNNGIYDYQNGYGRILIENAIASPTPVELVSFTGTISNGNVLLNWVTATEVNNYGWEVQRNFEGDSFYETIGFVEGAGNSNSPHSYVFKDEPIQYGDYIYRIKQIDNDGTFEYNGTVRILHEHNQPGEEYLSSYPNPFNPQTNIVIAINYTSQVKLDIYNSIGEKVTTLYSGLLDEGEYNFSLNGQTLSSGTYIILLQTDREILKHKIVLLR